jgi:hypothetical protein
MSVKLKDGTASSSVQWKRKKLQPWEDKLLTWYRFNICVAVSKFMFEFHVELMFISQDEVLALIFLAIFLQNHCSKHLFIPHNIMFTYSRFRHMILIHDQTTVRACTLTSSLKSLNLLWDFIFVAWACIVHFSLQCYRHSHYIFVHTV